MTLRTATVNVDGDQLTLNDLRWLIRQADALDAAEGSRLIVQEAVRDGQTSSPARIGIIIHSIGSTPASEE